MTRIDSSPERVIPQGEFATGNIDFPEGTRQLVVSMTTPNWPDVSEGSISLALVVSRSQGPFVQEWSDPEFQYQKVYKQGLPVETLFFGASLERPFGPSDRMRLQFTTSTLFRTAYTIDANVALR